MLLSLSAVYGATLPGTSVTLSWNGSADANIAGYQVYVGTQSGNYTSIVPAVGTTATISGLADGATYYFAVTALNDLGMESGFSNEIIYTVPTTRPKLQLLLSPTKQIILRITGQPLHVYEIQASQDMRNWNVVGLVTLGLSVNLDFIDTTATGRPARFYRLREIL